MSYTETRQMLLANVAHIHDRLAAQWPREETTATLTPESVAALTEAGIFAMKVPAALGGLEADPSTQLLVLEALAEANPSASWCAMVGATGSGLPGAFIADEVVKQMYPGPRLPIGAIVAAPMGKTVAVEGGWRLTGRWPFVSGVRHSEWVTVGAMIPLAPDQAPARCMLCFPTGSATIHDNWQVAGLKGTGSCDISVENLFVPAGFVWRVDVDKPKRGGPVYRIGLPGFVVNEHAGFALGTARRALCAFAEGAARKSRGGSGSLSVRPAVQRMLGESEIRLTAAKSLAIKLNDNAFTLVSAGEAVPERLQAELRAIAVHCTEVAVDIVTRAFRFSGGGAVYDGSVLQQCLRDINVAAQHLMVSDIAYENLGQFMLGLPDASAMR